MSKDYSPLLVRSISDVRKGDWSPLEDPQSPFADWEFLRSLEDGGCVGGATGWTPLYLTLWDGDALVGATFLYEKTNSYGEYIFDWSWAEAALRAGIRYYPKLASAIPFTPASCRKFLIHQDRREEEEAIVAALLSRLRDLQGHFSSTHYYFTSAQENRYLREEAFLIRHSFQYHWENRGYARFKDFLHAFKSRKAKQVRKERGWVANLRISTSTGDELSAQAGADFFPFYLSTIEAKGAIPYLTREFFSLIFERLRHRILLIKAFDGEALVAQALYFYKGEKLFGRYWGSTREVEFLHFELCYYQGIEFAIKHGLSVFEAGAQGEHKIARGFLPTLTFSAHDFTSPGLKSAVAQFVEREKASIAETFKYLEEYSPFKSPTE